MIPEEPTHKTPLRRRMLEDMQLRNFASETQRNYIHHIKGLAQFYQTSPEHLDLEDIREYQLHLLNEKEHSPQAVNQFVSAAKFFYQVTVETVWPENALPRVRVPHKLPVILSPAEVDAFFRHVGTLRYRAALMTAYGAGLRVSEVVRLKIADIDSERLLLRVEQGKGKRDRYAMLSPRLLKAMRAWWRVERSPDWLFPGSVSGRHMNAATLQLVCRHSRPFVVRQPMQPFSVMRKVPELYPLIQYLTGKSRYGSISVRFTQIEKGLFTQASGHGYGPKPSATDIAMS